MKYPELLKDCKCITCRGCNRLELIEFRGTYRCDGYMKGAKDEQNRNTNAIAFT